MKLINTIYQDKQYRLRIQQEAVYFEPFFEKLKHIHQLKNEGHLIFSSDRTQSGSLLLYLLKINPVDPIEFNIPFCFWNPLGRTAFRPNHSNGNQNPFHHLSQGINL